MRTELLRLMGKRMSDKYVKAKGILTGGKLKISDEVKFRDGLAFLGNSDKKGNAIPTKVVLTIEKDFGYRSSLQISRFYAGYVSAFQELTGYAKHEAEAIIKDRCSLFHFEYKDLDGTPKKGTRSLRDSFWTTKELNKLLVWTYEFIISIDNDMAKKMESPY